jgi:hypothetical protein
MGLGVAVGQHQRCKQCHPPDALRSIVATIPKEQSIATKMKRPVRSFDYYPQCALILVFRGKNPK